MSLLAIQSPRLIGVRTLDNKDVMAAFTTEVSLKYKEEKILFNERVTRLKGINPTFPLHIYFCLPQLNLK